jgi:hypothetical protein
MLQSLVLHLVAGVLAACASASPRASEGRATPVALKSCDDGGDGGVMIDGVCL